MWFVSSKVVRTLQSVLVVCSLFLSSAASMADPIKVTFLNPGDPDDPFFGPLEGLMSAAAEDLDIQLEALHASRNHLQLRRISLDYLAKGNRPDYLVVINEKGMAVEIMQEANKLGIKTFLFNEGLSERDASQLGEPGENLIHWIGQLLPDDRLSGQLLARTLIQKAHRAGLKDRDGKIHLVGINGTRKTNSAKLRLDGLNLEVLNRDDVVIHQVVYAHWDEEQAYNATKGLLARYPKTSVIWAASDGMSVGATRALADLGKKPGRDVVTGGVDWAAQAFRSIREGKMSATVGGHVFDGAWVMVMLRDFHEGRPLPRTSYSRFSAVTEDNINRVEGILKHPEIWSQLDFSIFRRSKQDGQDKYDFRIERLMAQRP